MNGNVTHFQITRNVVHDNNNIGIDIIGFERTAPDPAVDQARDGVVSDNSSITSPPKAIRRTATINPPTGSTWTAARAS